MSSNNLHGIPDAVMRTLVVACFHEMHDQGMSFRHQREHADILLLAASQVPGGTEMRTPSGQAYVEAARIFNEYASRQPFHDQRQASGGGSGSGVHNAHHRSDARFKRMGIAHASSCDAPQPFSLPLPERQRGFSQRHEHDLQYHGPMERTSSLSWSHRDTLETPAQGHSRDQMPIPSAYYSGPPSMSADDTRQGQMPAYFPYLHIPQAPYYRQQSVFAEDQHTVEAYYASKDTDGLSNAQYETRRFVSDPYRGQAPTNSRYVVWQLDYLDRKAREQRQRQHDHVSSSALAQVAESEDLSNASVEYRSATGAHAPRRPGQHRPYHRWVLAMRDRPHSIGEPSTAWHEVERRSERDRTQSLGEPLEGL